MQKQILMTALVVLATPLLAQSSHAFQVTPPTEGVAPFASHQAAKKAPQLLPIAGRIFLPDGKVAANARVFLSWQTDQGENKFASTVADAAGHFQQAVPKTAMVDSNGVNLTAYVPAHGWRICHVMANDKKRNALGLHLKPGVSLTGRLVHINGTPAAGVDIHVASLNSYALSGTETAEDQQGVFMFGTGVSALPDKAIASLSGGRTDATGRFTLTDLPQNSIISVTPNNGLKLTSGSQVPLIIGSEQTQETGILVAAQVGSLKIVVRDSVSGKPIAGANVQVAPSVPSQSVFLSTAMLINNVQLANSGTVSTDAMGQAEFKGLLPDDYTVAVNNKIRHVHIEAGQTTQTLAVSLRQGPLKVRVVDAVGKPVAKATLRVQGFINTELQRALSSAGLSFHIGPLELQNVRFSRGQLLQAAAMQPNNSIETDAQGRVTLMDFAWEQDAVTIRVMRGNDMAQWSGKPAKLGLVLQLQLHPGALVSVSGRLLDPQRRPISRISCQALHWQNTPRSTWFATAKQIKADAQGRFHVDGLERGEAFSLVAFSNGQQHHTTHPTLAENFESPRFVTNTAGSTQDLGDVTVHPSDEPAQVLQAYTDNPDQVVSLPGVLPTPTAEAAEAAKQVFVRYHQALTTGDLETVHALTSPNASGWSENHSDFLMHSTFCGKARATAYPAETLTPVRFMPRSMAATLLQQNRVGLSGSGTDLTRDLGNNANWVFLVAKQGEGTELAGMLHKEDDQWRVVPMPLESIGNAFLSGNSIALQQAALVSLPASPGAQISNRALDAADMDQARKLAERYLYLWSQGRLASMLAMTSHLSPLGRLEPAPFKEQFVKRPDEGAFPLGGEEKATLQPVTALSGWEQEMLMTAAINLPGNLQNIPFNNMVTAPSTLATFQYTAQGQTFLMVLAKEEGEWRVVEPALPQ